MTVTRTTGRGSDTPPRVPSLHAQRHRHYQDPGARALTVLAAIAATGDPGSRYASVRHLGVLAHYSPRSVNYALRTLERDRLLTRTTNGGIRLGRAKRATNAYALTATGQRRLTEWLRARQAAGRPIARPLTYAERRTIEARARDHALRARRTSPTIAHNLSAPRNIRIDTGVNARARDENGAAQRRPPPEPPPERTPVPDTRREPIPTPDRPDDWCPVNAARWPDLPWHAPGRDGLRCVDCHRSLRR